jgi:hypothetical protein
VSCNGYNHRPDCPCGFRGGTGGSRAGSNTRASPVRVLSPANGFLWRAGTRTFFETYLNPNASCPVCGASIFFYQSPEGGRVFFDELGPPWPKHPCTDRSLSELKDTAIIEGRYPTGLVRARSSSAEAGWLPLLNVKTHIEDGILFISGVAGLTRLLRRFSLRTDREMAIDGPIFHRHLADKTGRYELNFLAHDPQNQAITPRTVCAYSEVQRVGDVDVWEKAFSGEAAAQNLVGMKLSFYILSRKLDDRYCDWIAANYWFSLSAEQGHWAALNNLGRIYSEGRGVKPDQEKAFALFEQAAESLDPVPLRHLANCYERGFGVEPDSIKAAHFKRLAESRVRKEQSK